MTPHQILKQLLELAERKTGYIDDHLLALEKLLDKLSPKLADAIAAEVLSNLDVKDGVIQPTISNQNKVLAIDSVFNSFMKDEGLKVMTVIANDLMKISSLNEKYFKELSGEKIDNKKINDVILNRLGMKEDGTLKRDGFMKGLFENAETKKAITDFAMEKVTNGTGFEDLRTGLKELITGDDKKMGKFKQYYRNAAYDTYVKIDALNGKLYGDKLGLNYFIYAGTRRKTSRHFCIERKGKVFSREEAEKWHELIGAVTVSNKGKVVPAGPILLTEDATTYNPFIDRGGYGCVDDIMWIGDEVAFSMRPELRETKTK